MSWSLQISRHAAPTPVADVSRHPAGRDGWLRTPTHPGWRLRVHGITGPDQIDYLLPAGSDPQLLAALTRRGATLTGAQGGGYIIDRSRVVAVTGAGTRLRADLRHTLTGEDLPAGGRRRVGGGLTPRA